MEETSLLENLKRKLSFVKSNNLAAAGRFLFEEYVPMKNDLYTIEKIGESINVQLLREIEKQLKRIKAFNDGLILKRKDGRMGLKIQAGKECHFNFNARSIEKLETLLKEIRGICKKLSESKDLFKDTFKTSELITVTNKAKRKYNNSFKTEKRRKRNERTQASALFEILGGELVDNCIFEPECGVGQITYLEQETLEDAMRGKKRRALEVLHTALVFREQAFDIVDEYLFPKSTTRGAIYLMRQEINV